MPFRPPESLEQQRERPIPRGFLTLEEIQNTPAPRPGEPHTYVRCPVQRGFGVYITSQNVRTYFFTTRVNGETQLATFKSVDAVKMKDARAWAKDMANLAGRGQPISNRKRAAAAKPTSALTFARAYQLYKTDQTSTRRERPWAPRTLEKYETMLTRLAPWHGRELFSIKKAEVSARFIELRELHGVTETSQTFRNFRALWNFHAADVEPVPAAPTAVLSHQQKDLWVKFKPKTRIIAEADFPAWWRSLDGIAAHLGNESAWALYFRMLPLTGCRRTELLKAEWAWYDASTRVLTLPAAITKPRREHKVLIGPRLAGMLAAHRATQPQEWRFLFAGGAGIRLAHPDNVLKRHRLAHPELRPWSPHDLRRVYLSVAHKLRVPWKAMKMLVNHSIQGDVTLGYIQVEDLREHQEAIEAAIFKRAKVR